MSRPRAGGEDKMWKLAKGLWQDQHIGPVVKLSVFLVAVVIVVGCTRQVLEVRAAGWDWDCLWVQCRKVVEVCE